MTAYITELIVGLLAIVAALFVWMLAAGLRVKGE